MYPPVSDLLAELSLFPGREDGLRKIKRYSNEKVAFYRSSDFSHSKRVAWLVYSLIPLLSEVDKTFDIGRAVAMALVHDDAELITGDHQAGNKSKMTKEQLAAIADEEREAIAALAKRYPKTLGGYVYQDLVQDLADLKNSEAHFVKYFDRFDALGETYHELFAGNVVWTQNVVNEWGIIPTPFMYYYDRLPPMVEKYPILTALKGKHVFFDVPEAREWESFVLTRQPHTKDSILASTGHRQYDAWRSVVIDSADQEEIANLYSQQEYL
ncbi:MAG TPA: YfbR-like 5'-deoxynucleotidase [Candidatus Paceibacterota bacterium]|nr:YfbR-like 5'-deoxynucleotidase [Candidatus Paceibacterota bacterium]